MNTRKFSAVLIAIGVAISLLPFLLLSASIRRVLSDVGLEESFNLLPNVPSYIGALIVGTVFSMRYLKQRSVIIRVLTALFFAFIYVQALNVLMYIITTAMMIPLGPI